MDTTVSVKSGCRSYSVQSTGNRYKKEDLAGNLCMRLHIGKSDSSLRLVMRLKPYCQRVKEKNSFVKLV